MEYIYFDHDTINQPEELKNFKNLMYKYEGWNDDEGYVEIVDRSDEYVASFRVKPDTCYLLQRRNQSALQLHEMTPPRVFRERIPWLFGFGSKHRCDGRDKLDQICQEYQAAHPDIKVIVRDISHAGSYLTYAFAIGKYTTPVAYYRTWAKDTAWAFFGGDTICEFIAAMYEDLNFKYPMQYVVRLVKSMATFYPTPTKEFFQERLGIYDKSLYFAGEYGGF